MLETMNQNPAKLNITVLFFASVRQAVGQAQVQLELPQGATVNDLKADLQVRYPATELLLGHARWAVNEQFAGLDQTLHDQDTVAVIMPVSGGSGGEPSVGPPELLIAELTDQPIDTQGLLARVTTPSCGAVCLFLGTVREFTGPKQTVDLVYEAYPEMALKELRAILAEACSRWPMPRLGVIHRLGLVGLAEASIAVAVATPHRGESFAACGWIMDEIKQRVPIWKQEHWANGQTEWVHPAGS